MVIGIFRVEMRGHFSENKVELISVDSDLKMYINIISPKIAVFKV